MTEIGFIITRHVRSEIHNQYWMHSYDCIRKFYDYKIIIIDDGSDPAYLTTRDDLVNCEIIQTEFLKRGELLPYYYFYKYKYFQKAIILHDSVFIQKYIDFTKYGDIKFIWHFNEPGQNIDYYYYPLVTSTQTKYKSIGNTDLINQLKEFHLTSGKKIGCFGTMSVIDHNFLQKIEDKYGLMDLMEVINNRNDRCALERIFATFCTYLNPELVHTPSIFGDIFEYLKNTNIRWEYTFQEYKDRFYEIPGKYIANNDIPIVKVWSAR